jgi:hypothetical protein
MDAKRSLNIRRLCGNFQCPAQSITLQTHAKYQFMSITYQDGREDVKKLIG